MRVVTVKVVLINILRIYIKIPFPISGVVEQELRRQFAGAVCPVSWNSVNWQLYFLKTLWSFKRRSATISQSTNDEEGPYKALTRPFSWLKAISHLRHN